LGKLYRTKKGHCGQLKPFLSAKKIAHHKSLATSTDESGDGFSNSAGHGANDILKYPASVEATMANKDSI
jgi:hypothetical protein